jgi:hypothetical protein
MWLTGYKFSHNWTEFSPTCVEKKNNLKPTIAQCLSLALPMKNTWAQIKAVSIPPILPKIPRVTACCRVLTLSTNASPAPAYTSRIPVSGPLAGYTNPISREDTLPRHLAWDIRGERREEGSNTWFISFFLPSITSPRRRGSFGSNQSPNLKS